MMDTAGKKQNSPMVSVIMPAYNAERFIGEAIRSVQNQTVTDWELLVLDDGSRDATCAIVERMALEDPRIVLIRNEVNMGVAKTRNRGFDICRGAYVALLDSDDVWHPEKLEAQIARLRETGADIAYCSYAIVNVEGQKVRADYLVPETTNFDRLLRENVIGCSTVILTAEVLGSHRFETDFYHEDYVLWLRLLRNGFRAVGCGEVLVDWRFLENSRSFNKRRSAQNRWKVYRDYLQLPVLKSIWVFLGYIFASIRKYYRKN